MVRGQEQSTGRIIPSGWSEADGFPAARTRGEDGPTIHSPGLLRMAAVLTALSLLAVAMPWLLLRADGPEEVVRSYLDALIVGDLETVREHLEPAESAVGAVLSESLRAATPDRIIGFTVEEVTVRGTVATVRVRLRNAVEERLSEFSLTAVSQGALRAPRWELEPIPLPRLDLGPRTSTEIVLLNGRRIEIPEVHWTGRRTDRPRVVVHVLPGTYTVELPPTTAPLVPRSTEVYVPPVLAYWQTGLITVDYRPSGHGLDAARSVILGALRQCLHSGVARPPGCPFGADLPADTRGTWRMLGLPEITFTAMMGETFDYRGQELLVEFIEATHPDLRGELAAAGPRLHRMNVDFGVTLRQDGPRLEVQHWAYTTRRPWPQ